MGDEKLTIDQSTDFLVFVIDGQEIVVDVLAAHAEFAKIDFRHKDDPWLCYACQSEVSLPAEAAAAPKCPTCGCEDSEQVRKDEAWLDDVAAWVVRQGAERCGRMAAAVVYSKVVDVLDDAKKKPEVTLESHSGSESTAEAGAE